MHIRRKKNIQHKRITVGDIAISYLKREGSTGMDHPLLFIHGFPFNKNMWIKQLEALPEDQTGIAIDVRGHGNSTMGHGFFSIDLFARDLLEFMRKKGIKKAVLCGVSMGGYIALRAHQLAPEKFSALILSDTNSLSDDNAGKLKRFETIKSVLKHGNRTFALNFAKNVFSEHSIQNNPYDVEMIKSSIRRNNVRSICATLLALASRTDTTDHLKNIQIPTLLIWGAEDEVTPKSQAEILMEHIPGAQFIEFEKCGHLPSLEDSDRFNQVMASFIAAMGH